jgi:solute carrier family 25 iron transporter 28/37
MTNNNKNLIKNFNFLIRCTHLVTYDFLQSVLNKKREYDPMSHCISGAMAGALAAAITTPLDVCKTTINTFRCCMPDHVCTSSIGITNAAPQASTSSNINSKMNIANTAFVRSQSTSASTATPTQINGLHDAARYIYKVEGARGFFKGIAPRTLFQIPGTAVSWSVYEYFKHSLQNKSENSTD